MLLRKYSPHWSHYCFNAFVCVLCSMLLYVHLVCRLHVWVAVIEKYVKLHVGIYIYG